MCAGRAFTRGVTTPALSSGGGAWLTDALDDFRTSFTGAGIGGDGGGLVGSGFASERMLEKAIGLGVRSCFCGVGKGELSVRRAALKVIVGRCLGEAHLGYDGRTLEHGHRRRRLRGRVAVIVIAYGRFARCLDG